MTEFFHYLCSQLPILLNYTFKKIVVPERAHHWEEIPGENMPGALSHATIGMGSIYGSLTLEVSDQNQTASFLLHHEPGTHSLNTNGVVET